MFKALIRLLALIVALQPALAGAQTYPTVPDNSVIGRLGAGGRSGPSQAIPFATLKAQLGLSTVSIAALRALAPRVSDSVNVLGYYTAGDDGGGNFIWNNSSTAADNGGSIIAPTAGGTGRWVRQTAIPNQYTPKMFGAKSDGVNDDGPPIRSLMNFLGATALGGNIQLACNTTYFISSLSTNSPQASLIKPLSNVNITGCGANSKIRMGAGMNTSSASFVWGIYSSGTVNNARYANFTMDMNGANNSCSGTCWASNAAIGVAIGDKLAVENVDFIDNPGSNDTVFGTAVATPTVTNLRLNGNRHTNSGTAVNAAAVDFSADFFIATNATLSNTSYSNAGHSVSTPFEAHGTNIVVSSLTVSDYYSCGFVSNLASETTSNVNVGAVSCMDTATGLAVFSFASGPQSSISIHDIDIKFLTGNSGYGIDACTQMNATSGPNVGLSISDITISSDVTTNLGNEAPGVAACRWSSVQASGIVGTNLQGPGFVADNIPVGSTIRLSNSHFTNPGRTSTAANQVGVRFLNTSGNAAGNISIENVTSSGTVQYNISGNVNATQGTIDASSLASGATIDQRNWTGTGMAAVTFPQAQTNLRSTGGTGQFVKQASAGGALSVSAPVVSELGGLGTGVAAALANALNAAGGVAPVTSPTFTGTPAAPTAAVDTNTTQLATTAMVLAQAAAATPLAATSAGAVGTSTRFARADHQHPASNTYSHSLFSAGNTSCCAQNTTTFFTYSAASTESVVAIPAPQVSTFDKLYCSTVAAPAAGQTFTMTMRKNAVDQALTCQMTSAGATCNDTTHSFSTAAGDLIDVKIVTSATSGSANGMNCGVRVTTVSP